MARLDRTAGGPVWPRVGSPMRTGGQGAGSPVAGRDRGSGGSRDGPGGGRLRAPAVAHVRRGGLSPSGGGAQDPRRRLSELSAEALAKNNEQFLTLADSKLNEVRTATQGDLSQRQQAIAQLLDPLSETLARYERGLRDMEVERKGAYATLQERVAALHVGHEQLQKETRNLVTALRSPQTRGRWGEMNLRNAVKAAGMAEHCDFDEQRTTTTADGMVRPDMIVHLPGGGEVVIDSKVPLDAFLKYSESEDEDERKAFPRSTPPNCAPTWTSCPRRSTGSSSRTRPSWSSPSSRGTHFCRPLTKPTRGCRRTRWRRASCSPPRTC